LHRSGGRVASEIAVGDVALGFWKALDEIYLDVLNYRLLVSMITALTKTQWALDLTPSDLVRCAEW